MVTSSIQALSFSTRMPLGPTLSRFLNEDPQFLQDAAKLDLEITPVTAAAITDLLADIYRTPKSTVEKAVAAIQK